MPGAHRKRRRVYLAALRFNQFILIFVCSILLTSCANIQTADSIDASLGIEFQSVQNARQLGPYVTDDGFRVRAGVILRSGELAGITEHEIETLVREYELAHIIDLRDENEAESAPDPVIEGVQNHHLIVWPRAVRERLIQESYTECGFDSELYISKYYEAFALEPAAIEAYREMFEVLLENESGGVLIHCVHGKDRTGIAITLILSALGSAWEDIETEYLLSNETYEGRRPI